MNSSGQYRDNQARRRSQRVLMQVGVRHPRHRCPGKTLRGADRNAGYQRPRRLDCHEDPHHQRGPAENAAQNDRRRTRLCCGVLSVLFATKKPRLGWNFPRPVPPLARCVSTGRLDPQASRSAFTSAHSAGGEAAEMSAHQVKIFSFSLEILGTPSWHLVGGRHHPVKLSETPPALPHSLRKTFRTISFTTSAGSLVHLRRPHHLSHKKLKHAFIATFIFCRRCPDFSR